MANKKMPTPDIALKEFFKDNKKFAAVFNGFLFKGKSIVNPDSLEPADTAYTEAIEETKGVFKINKFRDVIRRSNMGHLVILGIENQDKIHYAMPIRKMLYDSLSYTAEINSKANAQDRTKWDTNERLSNAGQDTRITPVITVVFYTGEKKWDGPRSLYDMMDLDDMLKQFVPNYPLLVIDLAHDESLSFPDEMLEHLRTALSDIYGDTGETDETEMDSSVLSLAGILAGDPGLYQVAQKGGRQKMCEALQKRDEPFRAEIAKKDKEIAKKDKVIEEQATRIKELEAQLASRPLSN